MHGSERLTPPNPPTHTALHQSDCGSPQTPKRGALAAVPTSLSLKAFPAPSHSPSALERRRNRRRKGDRFFLLRGVIKELLGGFAVWIGVRQEAAMGPGSCFPCCSKEALNEGWRLADTALLHLFKGERLILFHRAVLKGDFISGANVSGDLICQTALKKG